MFNNETSNVAGAFTTTASSMARPVSNIQKRNFQNTCRPAAHKVHAGAAPKRGFAQMRMSANMPGSQNEQSIQMNADQTMKIDHTMKMTSKTLSSRWGAQSIDMESKRANITGPSMNSKVRADFGQSIKGMQQQAPQYKDNQFFIDQIDSIRKTANLKGKFSKMTTANAAKDNVSFSVSGASTNVVKDNFQDNYFGGAVRNIGRNIGGFARPQQRMRASVAMMALPPWAEGDWGDEIKKRKYMVGGNWKCNGDFDFAVNFPKDVLNKSEFSADNMDVAVAPTYLHLSSVKAGLDSKVNLCAQDVSEKEEGAFTGNISAKQLTDMGINWTLTGHSERRELFGETDEITALKTKLAIENGMNVMLCIGEKKEERENGFTDEVNARQLEAVKDALETSQWGNVVIAYEPVWAIGTGLTATPEIAQDTHFNIRCWLAENISPEVAAATRILYGGSANAQNAPDLIKQKDIDGFLVGGASLKPDFNEIIKAVDTQKSSEK